jgi:hypothetical protein
MGNISTIRLPSYRVRRLSHENEVPFHRLESLLPVKPSKRYENIATVVLYDWKIFLLDAIDGAYETSAREG